MLQKLMGKSGKCIKIDGIFQKRNKKYRKNNNKKIQHQNKVSSAWQVNLPKHLHLAWGDGHPSPFLLSPSSILFEEIS